ncbi:hypothetical protein [Shimia sp. SDUM112013]|uniref:hypothetical protein n=1 Tax=Shimia sp. SDUM112013 TaxID=3136160 RepID=UPI0032ECC205
MFVALGWLTRIPLVFLIAHPALSDANGDRNFLCQEMWAKAVFYDERKLNW